MTPRAILSIAVLARLDEPTGDASILPTYLLCAFARENVTVALSGDGGDELFAGYDPFRRSRPPRSTTAWCRPEVTVMLRRLGDCCRLGTPT